MSRPSTAASGSSSYNARSSPPHARQLARCHPSWRPSRALLTPPIPPFSTEAPLSESPTERPKPAPQRMSGPARYPKETASQTVGRAVVKKNRGSSPFFHGCLQGYYNMKTSLAGMEDRWVRPGWVRGVGCCSPSRVVTGNPLVHMIKFLPTPHAVSNHIPTGTVSLS
jgi:hypothetical protein